jgi:tetratricopeptide (TPR) repeat protein
MVGYPMLSHQAYFEFLAGSDQNVPVWQPVLAGLAVMRLIDSRIAHDRRGESDWASVESAKSAVRAISEGDPVRAILLQLIEAVSGVEIQRDAVGRGLLAYGRALDFDGRWALACDVFATADTMTGAPANARISVESNIALGATSRRMGDWDTSTHAYARAAYLAGTVGDTAGVLQVEVGRANTHMLRGNLPVAESMLEEVIEQARIDGSNDVLGLALLSRASVAHLRGAYADAVRIGYEALETTRNPTTRDTILSDIAAAFAGLGLRDAARDSYLIVTATAQSQWVRWQATLNLMELAGIDGREADFDAYAREMEAAPLDPRLRAYYFMFLGAGQQGFGREIEAEISLAEGLAFAEKNQLHQIAHEASVAIEELKSHEGSRREGIIAPAEIEPSLQKIVSDLSTLREAATSSS